MRCVAVLVFVAASLLACARGMYSKKGSVKLLDTKSFRKEVQKDSGVWIVEFYAPWCGHCKNLAPEYKKASKALEGVVNVAAINCDDEKELMSEFGVSGFPTIMIFGGNKANPTTFNGERTAKGIVDAALKTTRRLVESRLLGGTEKVKRKSKSDPKKKSTNDKSSVIKLSDDTFNEMVLNSGEVWLVEFYAPWCGHCKALAPEWEQAALNLKGSVKVAAIDGDANKHKSAEYGVKGFPTIKVFGPNAMGPEDSDTYQGERTASAITEFGLSAVDSLGGGQRIKQLVSADELVDFCEGKSSCVITLLPHITEGGKSAREGFINTLEEAAKLVRGKPFKFGWMQGGDQLDFESRFELTFGYPSLVAINLDRKRYVVQRGAFTAEAIGEFLQGVIQGRESTVGFDELPEIKTVKHWDGEDVKLDEIEDDDEDDDIMNEILGNTAKDEL
ncbi:RxLR-like protein [Plasmopara halstedii]|uniref:protein disulfide-isomerase n=1 Tax=Plasmopara halstedii TaxID=4781 RepID=A0A0P1AU08_PLAHL|nr:RxLR-like protein [Plasmopara halstedii]CEG44200.1 RxLR-like protein [Plasmopara halstedii]|eukprot:XP_024580569.1 RxLR-like protein [Plasmopara halstedii]